MTLLHGSVLLVYGVCMYDKSMYDKSMLNAYLVVNMQTQWWCTTQTHTHNPPQPPNTQSPLSTTHLDSGKGHFIINVSIGKIIIRHKPNTGGIKLLGSHSGLVEQCCKQSSRQTLTKAHQTILGTWCEVLHDGDANKQLLKLCQEGFHLTSSGIVEL